ncbi:MAG: PhnD/SsuA/transferrin family substrate-binding protein [Proteobacteria bacterium]|nr:PhnD/SsuA/transferrin family substrate-binding protein [Pseudomonadota bacterium]
MSAAFVSEQGVSVYRELTDYLTRRLQRPVQLITGLAYDTINSMLEAGVVHVGFVCGLPYVLLRDQPKPAVELLAAPIMQARRYQGMPKYYSDLIVKKDSPYQKLEDLAGARFVYNEEISNSGYNLPRHHLFERGLKNRFFGALLRSGSHEESIRMVASGQAEFSFVDSLVLDYDRAMGNGSAHLVRVLLSIGPAGIPPVVGSTRAPADLRESFKKELLHMHRDPEGRRILNKALVDRFESVTDDNYNDIRTAYHTPLRAGYTEIK